MSKEQLREYIATGREIEFTYKNKEYSITYYNDKREKYISFCEAYEELLDVSSADELLASTYKGMSVKDVIESLTEDDCTIF